MAPVGQACLALRNERLSPPCTGIVGGYPRPANARSGRLPARWWSSGCR